MAIAKARSVHDGTSFIADISIDDETRWRFGYAVQCIVVRVQVTDLGLNTDTASITVNLVDLEEPVAVNDNYATDENEKLFF